MEEKSSRSLDFPDCQFVGNNKFPNPLSPVLKTSATHLVTFAVILQAPRPFAVAALVMPPVPRATPPFAYKMTNECE